MPDSTTTAPVTAPAAAAPTADAAAAATVPAAAAMNKLQSEWAFWYDERKPHTTDFTDYKQSLIKLSSFGTLEGFWQSYSNIANPDSYPRECSLYLVRGKSTPAWESFPNGGCWIIRVRKRNTLIDRLWEELCFACVGELFAHPDVCCIGVSTRNREDVLTVWNIDNSNPNTRFVIGEKLRELLNLDSSTQVDYKTFLSAIQDKSSFKNAQSYMYAAPAANVSLPAPGAVPSSLPTIAVDAPAPAPAAAAAAAAASKAVLAGLRKSPAFVPASAAVAPVPAPLE
jgi:translation initiation factor 4E